MNGYCKRKYGFTIVELLIGIVVIAILATISLLTYRGMQDRAANIATLSAAKSWNQAINYRKIKGTPIAVDPAKVLHNTQDQYFACLGRSDSAYPKDGTKFALAGQCYGG